MQNRRRPRALTLTLPNSKQPFLTFEGERHVLRNVSEDGIGVWVPSEKAFGLTPKTTIKGDIVIDRQIHPVTLEVVHSAKGYVGLKILNADPKLLWIFKELLEPSNYVTELLPSGRSGTELSETGFTVFEYRAGSSVVFSFQVGRSNDIKSISVRILGRWVGRDQFQGIRTAIVSDLSYDGLGAEEDFLMHDSPDADFFQAAAQFVASLPPPLPAAKLWYFLESGEQVFIPDELLKKTV